MYVEGKGNSKIKVKVKVVKIKVNVRAKVKVTSSRVHSPVARRENASQAPGSKALRHDA